MGQVLCWQKLMANYYGQFDTDKIIEQYFPGKVSGLAVEVGASHGTVSSNTKHFEELGWTCLCIEPNPDLYRELKVNRPLTINCAVSKQNADDVAFHIVRLTNGDMTAISGLELDAELIKTHPISSIEEIRVPARTLDTCLNAVQLVPPIDFISIDTEGTELDVLVGTSLDYWNPYLLIVENNHNKPYIAEYLAVRGYTLHQRHVINDFYTRD